MVLSSHVWHTTWNHMGLHLVLWHSLFSGVHADAFIIETYNASFLQAVYHKSLVFCPKLDSVGSVRHVFIYLEVAFHVLFKVRLLSIFF